MTNNHARSPLLFLLAALAAGCGARSELGLPAAAKAGSDAGAPLCGAPEGGAPLIIDTFDQAGNTEPEAMGRPAWAGDRFGVAWHQYRPGGSAFLMTTVRCEDGRPLVDPPVQVAGDVRYSSPHIVWDGDSFAVFWSADGELFLRRFDRDRSPLGDAFLVAGQLGPNAAPIQVLYADGLHNVLFLDDREAQYLYAPYFIQVSTGGALVGDELRLLPPDMTTSPAGLATRGGRFFLAWASLQAGSTGTSFVSEFAPGQAPSPPVQVYSGSPSSPRVSSIVAEAFRLDIGIHNPFDPPLLVQLGDEGVLGEAALPQGTAELDLALTSDGSLGGITGAGAFSASNPIATTLLFQAFADGKPAGLPVTLNQASASAGVMLERYLLIGGDHTFAALWLEDAPAGAQPNRTLYFAEVAR